MKVFEMILELSSGKKVRAIAIATSLGDALKEATASIRLKYKETEEPILKLYDTYEINKPHTWVLDIER